MRSKNYHLFRLNAMKPLVHFDGVRQLPYRYTCVGSYQVLSTGLQVNFTGCVKNAGGSYYQIPGTG